MSSQEFEAQLTLKDRLNFPYLLANQILTFQKAILNLEYSEREIREAIEGFVHLIPNPWKDEAWQKDFEEAVITRKKDLRPIVAGNIRMSEETCKELGIEAFKEEKVFDYYKMFQACIDLLNRKKMLSKVVHIEQLEGIDFDAITEDAFCESDFSSE